MEKREDALREALGKNEEEIQRWETYIKDNKTAINNLNLFSKRLTVDVMVPIGKKAYVPGRLIHTNEVLMGHYQDYFSKCSAFTATEICKKRIEHGKKHLEQLKAEKDLYQNKLEKPYAEGVFPNAEEREIIEEYDEERERVWREKHRQRVKEAKLKERLQREQQPKIDIEHEELIQTLEEEEEILKELNKDLGEREIKGDTDTQELLKKIMSGEVPLPPPKRRIAHSTIKHDGSVPQIPIDTNIQSIQPIANNLVNSFDNKYNQNCATLIRDGNDSDTSIASDTPEEVRLIEKQAEYLPQGDRIGFYQYQLQIIEQKIVTHKFSNSIELERKLRLFKIRDHLEELIEILDESTSETDPQSTDLNKNTKTEKISENPPKRRISFASENQMLEFRKNETVAQMMPNKSPTEEKPPRDIIRLDEPILPEVKQPAEETGENDSNRVVERRKTILEKVEENLKTQNLEDADLVNKIIHSCVNKIETLHIHFKHSTQKSATSGDDKVPPANPSDLYNTFNNGGNINSSADDNFYLKEDDRERAYVDVRSEFFSPTSNENISPVSQSRSILKNKAAVDREVHIIEQEEKPKAPQQKKAKKPKQEDEYLSAYNKVMSDVIENPTTIPDPLPDGKYVDMHTPKKRISRFKQMRNENK